ncbi:hypothetical protein CANCADRAFT_74955 [Tortispora caseinolytica NRRL Y-17796]|uniref:Uncharacterized protein n=1 Tax=Tortispora caseinolytica NRRL Y-17796 TaxID=767744 RepID=A0A1E4TIZ5_9ASCO|nr:hypothetical protein CANCADRAFT_74955 [Tortispora caseinolytica NRRL Y-17796]
MRQALILWHKPLIHFIGRRSWQKATQDLAPKLHPLDPHKELPSSFAAYRLKAQQHGPLVKSSGLPNAGEVIARFQLPKRFQYPVVEDLEIDIVNSGGAL